MAYPSTLRADAVALYDRCGSSNQVAAVLGLNRKTVCCWLDAADRARSMGGDRRSAAFRARLRTVA